MIDQKEIISIALLYEYIIYGDALSKEKGKEFTKAIQQELDYMNSSYEIDIHEIEEEDFSFEHYPWIQEDKKHQTYQLCDFEKNKRKIWEWYQKLPMEITHASLKEGPLLEIPVTKESFEIQKRYKLESGTKDIYSLEEARAKEIVKEILEQDGCKNIRILSAMPVQLDDKAYRVSYQCDMAYEYANVLRRKDLLNPYSRKQPKTIAISDTALLGANYQDSIEGIQMLNSLQKDGYKIVILSNRPEYCMRKIGGFTPKKENVYYRYLGPSQEKGKGIHITYFDEAIFSEESILKEMHLKADFTIFGNGIKVFDKNDETIYEGSYIDSATLERMVKNFRDCGYISYGEQISLQKDSLGDQCFKQGDRVYKFFTPEIGTETANDRVYGMQCSGICSYYDDLIIEYIEKENPTIRGYSLNLKPCFYQRNVNKQSAFQSLLEQNHGIDIDHTSFILNEPTDDVLLLEYGDLSYCLGSDLEEPKEDEDTLVKILNKISR